MSWCTVWKCQIRSPVMASNASTELANRFSPLRLPPQKSNAADPVGRKTMPRASSRAQSAPGIGTSAVRVGLLWPMFHSRTPQDAEWCGRSKRVCRLAHRRRECVQEQIECLLTGTCLESANACRVCRVCVHERLRPLTSRSRPLRRSTEPSSPNPAIGVPVAASQCKQACASAH